MMIRESLFVFRRVNRLSGILIIAGLLVGTLAVPWSFAASSSAESGFGVRSSSHVAAVGSSSAAPSPLVALSSTPHPNLRPTPLTATTVTSTNVGASPDYSVYTFKQPGPLRGRLRVAGQLCGRADGAPNSG